MGIKLSRKIFAYLFVKVAPYFKSKKIIEKNLYIFNSELSESEKKRIIGDMWRNYGMTFIEYIFLDKLRDNNYYVEVFGDENLNSVINNKPVILFQGILQILNLCLWN